MLVFNHLIYSLFFLALLSSLFISLWFSIFSILNPCKFRHFRLRFTGAYQVCTDLLKVLLLSRDGIQFGRPRDKKHVVFSDNFSLFLCVLLCFAPLFSAALLMFDLSSCLWPFCFYHFL